MSNDPSPTIPKDIAAHWQFPDGVTYLNHGSFGPSALSVQQAREDFSRQLESNPMNFLTRKLEDLLDGVCNALGQFLGCSPRDLALVDNATFAMNAVARTIDLHPGDEVLLADHEYGAVQRIWRNTCKDAGAKVVTQSLPNPVTSKDELVKIFFEGVTPNTKLIVVSHITSPTALILPVEEICAEARKRGILSCVDGPHAIAMLPVNLRRIDADFYCASCHKWLAAPFGSGFLYVKPRFQKKLTPAVISWGGSLSGREFRWQDELHWSGTRDPAAFLAIPSAIEFLEGIGLENFRTATHKLAKYAREAMLELTGLDTFYPDDPSWYGSMITMPLPERIPVPTDWYGPHELQKRLWNRHQIEVPVTKWRDRLFLRISCHLYNTQAEIDRLIRALQDEMKSIG